jgi:hypothetical protein
VSLRPLYLALAAHALVMFLTVPLSVWEFDEALFLQSLQEYRPLAHHPPPPGYPVFAHAGELVRTFVPSDLATLVGISVAASLAGFALLALAFRNMTGDLATGIAGAMFFYWSPAMLLHAPLPLSDPGALALLAAALYYATEEKPELFALFASLTVGWRPQYAIFVVPMLFVAVWQMRSWRARLNTLGVFAGVCLVWLSVLSLAVGGVSELIDFEIGQGKYLAAHDAAESRTGWTTARIAFRFIGRAWGTELTAPLVLGIAAIGFYLIIRKRVVWPMAAGALVYIAVALKIMDPADGVRYALPVVLFTAFLAGVGATSLSQKKPYLLPVIGALVFGAYVSPIVKQRRTSDSPPARAAEFARKTFPENAIALYELPLWPHATYLLADRHPERLDTGLARYWNNPNVSLFVYADGASARPDARVFQWKTSDAYRKLTRNHYRSISIIPLPPQRRFRPIAGVYAQERDRDKEGREWRWLAPAASLQLPDAPPRTLILTFGLHDDAPIATNEVTVSVNGQPAARARAERGRSTTVKVAVPAGAPTVSLSSASSFVPAEVPALRSGDRRHLAVELYDLVTEP